MLNAALVALAILTGTVIGNLVAEVLKDWWKRRG